MSRIALVVNDNSNNLLLEKYLREVAGFTLFTAANDTDSIAAENLI